MLKTPFLLVTTLLVFAQTFVAQNAVAQTATAASSGQPPAYMQFVPLIAVFAVMYFLMLRPQMKKQKEHQGFITKLSRGDEVVTNSGILGRIEGLTPTFLTLEIAPNVRIKVLRSAIAGSAKDAMNTPAVSNSDEVKA